MQRMLILTSPTPSASTALMLLYPYSRWSQLVFSPPSPFSWLGTLNASNPELSSPSWHFWASPRKGKEVGA
ncbi:uncharacterized protein BO72DRAFT_451181 [Aspergillus fijiensis CBS 313.89]|uniref:Uncharacterized protein n=1 Tax=Aspergillus fijiensis CBS 313.89 TaxID=1448319 RepID=A0A8G1RNQ2_9EURO|nr:uncharacterized protein BO72DRAFT_451181 [Aspergillus fijiensis CBS 313.89]RAK73866.1 hypothetical protein BO72DRAFT_451181 [Aspergillus fijiensis CBS 313.89]